MFRNVLFAAKTSAKNKNTLPKMSGKQLAVVGKHNAHSGQLEISVGNAILLAKSKMYNCGFSFFLFLF